MYRDTTKDLMLEEFVASLAFSRIAGGPRPGSLSTTPVSASPKDWTSSMAIYVCTCALSGGLQLSS